MKSTLYRLSLKSASVALVCLTASLVLSAGQQPANNEEFARRQYDSGMSFLQNHRYAEALKDLQAVVDSFGASSVAPGALLQIAQYQLEVARDVTATQTAIDRLLKDYANSDSAPMAHVLSGRLAMMKGHTPADVDAALASFERVPRLFPGTEGVAAAGFYAGEALRTVRRIDEALDRYRRVRMEYPRSEWAARASLGEGYCLVQQEKATRALPEIQWVRTQFPNSPVAAEALALNTIIYRLYVRPPAQPPYTFSGKSIGSERSDYRDVMGIQWDRDGRLLLGHKSGVAIFDDKGAVAGTVAGQDVSAFFVDEKNRIVIARNSQLVADKGETVNLIVPTQAGIPRALEELPSVIASKGDRLVSDPKGKTVLRLGADGKYQAVFSSTYFSRLVPTPLDEIAMLDRNTKSITIVDRDGKVQSKLAPKGQGYELDDPIDVGFDELGHMYVLDRGKNAVVVFGAKNKFIANVTMPEKSTGAFTRPAALGVDTAGRLFIFDERAKRIQVYQ
jgi:outer membrane protein assembly factor BamD (BamD/ComL family)